MGIISDLVRMKSEKDVQAKQGAIDAVKVVLTDPNATPEAREWATGSLTDLLDNHFHGKSGGGASIEGKAPNETDISKKTASSIRSHFEAAVARRCGHAYLD